MTIALPEPLEAQCEWTAADVQDPATWTERFSEDEIEELAEAIEHAMSLSDDLRLIGREAFPLPTLRERLSNIENDLINGRGFVRLRGLPRDRWSNDQMCFAYWGIGTHLGTPVPQNAKGHLLGDVTDQGKRPGDPGTRGNELGEVGLDYHCDGSDLVGLLCLQNGVSGGLSAICNSVILHNRLVGERPDLARALYEPQPHDMRGEEAPGQAPWRMKPVFQRRGERLFVHLIGPYIHASQRHEGAPRLSDPAREALQWLRSQAEDGAFSLLMELEPGDIQFINNYHVLHGRTPYVDDRPSGRIRHLKRLWLETRALIDRPTVQDPSKSHWARSPTISRLDATDTP